MSLATCLAELDSRLATGRGPEKEVVNALEGWRVRNELRSWEGELPERRSVGRKAEVVLRLLCGEDLGEVSRECGRE